MKNDDYLTSASYEGHGTADTDGFVAFQNESDGKYYFALLNRNHKLLLKSEAYHSTSARDNGLESVKKNRPLKERYVLLNEDGNWFYSLRAGNNTEIARSVESKSEGVAQSLFGYLTGEVGTGMEEDDYMACSDYENRGQADDNGILKFYNEANHHYYFALVDSDGKILLKSEGYPRDNSRDNGAESVLKNRKNQDFYSAKSENEKFYVSLRASNYKEIARSCDADTEAAALALIPSLMGTIEHNNDREIDDYLVCSAYEGHERMAGHPDFSSFQHRNGEYYFAWYNNDGSIKFRSESYPTIGARDNGLQSVWKNMDIKERYSTEEKRGFYYTILKAGNHQEIARSCPKKDEAAALALWPILSAAPIAMAAAAAVPLPDPVPVAAAIPIPVAAAVPPAPMVPKTESKVVPPVIVDQEAKGCAPWLWWLLGALLLLAALLYFMKGCKKEEAAANAIVTDTVAAAPITMPDTAAVVVVDPESAVDQKLTWIFFDFDSDALRSESTTELDKLVKVLNDNTGFKAELSANTDSKGDPLYNKDLSQRRAKSSKDYLISNGIDGSRIITITNGDSKSVAKNEVNGQDSEAGRQFNRRIEIKVTKSNGADADKVAIPEIPSELKK